MTGRELSRYPGEFLVPIAQADAAGRSWTRAGHTIAILEEDE